MKRDLMRRLDAVEQRAPHLVPERTPAELYACVASLCSLEACLVAFYLGHWRPGDDAIGCLEKGMVASHTAGQNRSLNWAAYHAEFAYSGTLGEWHSPERLAAAYEGIGETRHQLSSEIGDVLEHAEFLGDWTLIRLAESYRDAA